MMKNHAWHKEYEDNPYVDVIYTSIPPKYKWICARCGKVVYRECSLGEPEFEECCECSQTICKDCSYGEYRGYPPVGSPSWAVSTIYFWCPIKEHHNQFKKSCESFLLGEPKQIDKNGIQIDTKL